MTNTSSISNDLYYSSYQAPTKETGNGALGKDAFLQILITQLQNQDPSNPMDDREFIAQMAQFSSLEQMQNMTKAMQELLESQKETQLMSYTSFIGKEVKWHELTDELDQQGQYIVNEGTNVVKELKFSEGSPIFILDNGKEISSGNISSLLESSTSTSATSSSNPFAEASELIGQTVSFTQDGLNVQAIIEAITTKNNVIQYLLNDGSRLTRNEFELFTTDTMSQTI